MKKNKLLIIAILLLIPLISASEPIQNKHNVIEREANKNISADTNTNDQNLDDLTNMTFDQVQDFISDCRNNPSCTVDEDIGMNEDGSATLSGSAWESDIQASGLYFMDINNSIASGSYNTQSFLESTVSVTINGVKQEGFCIDPYLDVPQGDIQCNKLESGAGVDALQSLVDEYSAGGDYSYSDMQLIFRMASSLESFTVSDKNETSVKSSLDYYMKIRAGDADTIDKARAALAASGQCGNNSCATNEQLASKFIYGDTAKIEKAYNAAIKVAQQGGTAGYKDSVSSADKGGGSLTFQQGAVNGNQVTINITSDGTIPEDVQFQVAGGSVVQQSFNGQSGQITVALEEENCAYEIQAFYETSGMYECTSASASSQTIVANVKAESSQAPAQVHQGTVGAVECNQQTCCTEGGAIEPGHIEGDVNNCCDNTHSEAKEYELDDLFCYDEELKVEYFWKKCSIEYYKSDAELNDYCEMFCTERVTVDIPGPITAISGRYFTLEKNPIGNTTSAYIEGFKRCRIRIQYDKWESDYYAEVQKQVDNYNQIQYNRALEFLYQKAVDNGAKTQTGKLQGKASCSCTDKDGNELTAEGESDEVDYEYEYYEFPILFKDYHTIRINPDDRNIPSEVFNAVRLEYFKTDRVTHTKYSIEGWGEYIAEMDEATIPPAEEKCLDNLPEACGGSGGVDSSERNQMEHEGKSVTDESVPEVLGEIQSTIQSLTTAFNAAADKAKSLEEDIDVCNEYFTTGEGTNAEAHYKFNATQAFSYSQVYLDDLGKTKQDRIYIDFEDTPGCSISGPIIGGDGLEIADPRYSQVYKTGVEKMKDMKHQGEIKLEETTTGYRKYEDEQYDAKKVFTHDAKYKAVCEWEEGSNQLYTLVPNGAVTENTTTINKTLHNQEYRIHLTTLEGTYETFWDIRGLGEDGKFDNFFLENGTTCSNEDPKKVAMFTCKLKIEYEVVLTGYCNGTNGSDTNNDPEDCDPNKEMMQLFTFKIVDPSNLFPTDPMQNGEALYGYNWLVEPKGQQVLSTIQTRGKDDETYAIQNLTYSFDLTPTDMKHIKNYNETRELAGGYSDFTLTCECPSEPNPSDGCRRCKSSFLTNLSEGKITYLRTTHTMSGWANTRESLGQVRNKNNW